jgi:glycosyltransferase involved in cell wall biosynthesis
VIGPRSTAGINSLVRDGITGLLVDDVGLVNNLADAMRRLMHNSPLRRELGERARIDMETFSINRVVNAWSDTLFGDQSAAMAT